MSWYVRGLLALSLLMVAAENTAHLGAQEIHELEGPVRAAGSILNVFKLKSTGEHLSTKIQANYQQASLDFNQLQRELSSSGASSSSSTGAWRVQIRAENAAGLFRFGQVFPGRISGKPVSAAPEFQALLRELESPHRELKVIAESDGSFLIQLRSQTQPYLFRLRQDSHKQVTCCEIRADSVFSAKAATFDQFCRQNYEFVENRLMPVLKAIGAGAPTTRFSPMVQEFVLRQLKPEDPEKESQFRKAIVGLDGTDFEQRQQVTLDITKQYEQWQHLIQRVVTDSEYPVEVRSRLKKILESQVSGGERERMQLVIGANLNTDVDYLIWLWAQRRNGVSEKQYAMDEPQPFIQSHLQLLTGNDFGDDLNAWQEWWRSEAEPQPKLDNSKKVSLNEQLFGSMGPLDASQKVLSQLIEFKIENRDLVLDRDRWSKPFDGKPIQEINEEIAGLVAGRNFPTGWYQPGGRYTVESTDHPQVIFENLAEVLGPNQQEKLSYNRSVRQKISSLNRQIDCDSVFTRLEFHPRTLSEMRADGIFRNRLKIRPRQATKREYFSFFFREKFSPHRCIEVRETSEHELVVTLMSETTDAIVRLFQANRRTSGPRVRIWLINNGSTTSLEANDFEEFVRTNQAFFSEEVATLFEPMGIRFDVDRRGNQGPK